MAVSISTPYTTSTRQALSTSMREASMSATKMSTGKNYVHAYEDSTGFAIGSSMQSDLKILEIVATGVNQTQSMLYMVEEGMKAIHDTASKLNQILAKAKLGYMTDELVKNTLSPSYVQLKQEIDRIADSIEFNGQNLLNGTGGKKTAATVATVSSTPSYSSYTANSGGASAPTLAQFAVGDILTGLSATTVTAGTSGTVAFSVTTAAAPTVTGGTASFDSNTGDFVISGATITTNAVTVTDSASVKGVGSLAISNVTLKFKAGEFDYDSVNNKITSKTGNAPELSDLVPANVAWTYTYGTITAVSGFSGTAAMSIANGVGSELSNILASGATYALSGGVGASSTFNFVTGSDLNEAIVEVAFPNMRLTKANGVDGMISTINTSENINSVAPTDLTNLESVADADNDIPLVQALVDQIVVHFSQIGAYQSRLLNIQSQLATSVEQVDLAQGEIMNADLAKENEGFTRSNVKINVAIAVLGQMNSSLQSLQRLVQG